MLPVPILPHNSERKKEAASLIYYSSFTINPNTEKQCNLSRHC